MKEIREHLLNIFHAALDSVAGETVVRKELTQNEYPSVFHVVAIGKAADAMLKGVPSARIKSGLLVSKHGHITQDWQQDSRISCIESDHPTPRSASIEAGKQLLNYLAQLPSDEPCLFLISGGASALVEVLEDGWNLSQLQELTDYLLANAYPINEINAIRKRISKIKGGSLWNYLNDRPIYCLMISDVPDDDPAVIGSGLLFPKEDETQYTPPSFYTFLNVPKLPAYKKNTQANNFKWKVIASLTEAKLAAAEKARSYGYQDKIVPDFLEGEAAQVAVNCVEAIKEMPNVLFIWGGETTVHLPENPGMGGRNQHLALSAAMQIQNLESVVLISAGTDGSDGLTKATGAIVDVGTIRRGLAEQLDAQEYLKSANSNYYLDKTGDLIETGATGTNVMDLVLGINRI